MNQKVKDILDLKDENIKNLKETITLMQETIDIYKLLISNMTKENESLQEQLNDLHQVDEICKKVELSLEEEQFTSWLKTSKFQVV